MPDRVGDLPADAVLKTPVTPKSTTVAVEHATYQHLAKTAEERMVGIGYLANRLLVEGLERLVPVSELKLTKD